MLRAISSAKILGWLLTEIGWETLMAQTVETIVAAKSRSFGPRTGEPKGQ